MPQVDKKHAYTAAKRAIEAGQKFEKALKEAAEICEEESAGEAGVMAWAAPDLREFRSRVAQIHGNMQQHLVQGTYGHEEE